MSDEQPTAATNGPTNDSGVDDSRLTVPWAAYDVGDRIAVRDPYAGVAVPRPARVRAKDALNPDRPRVKVRYLDTQAVTWIAAGRILRVHPEAGGASMKATLESTSKVAVLGEFRRWRAKRDPEIDLEDGDVR